MSRKGARGAEWFSYKYGESACGGQKKSAVCGGDGGFFLFVCELCDVVAEGVFDAGFEEGDAVLVTLAVPLFEGVAFLEEVVVHLEEGYFKGCHLGVRGFLHLYNVYADYAGIDHVELFGCGA